MKDLFNQSRPLKDNQEDKVDDDPDKENQQVFEMGKCKLFKSVPEENHTDEKLFDVASSDKHSSIATPHWCAAQSSQRQSLSSR